MKLSSLIILISVITVSGCVSRIDIKSSDNVGNLSKKNDNSCLHCDGDEILLADSGGNSVKEINAPCN